VGYHGIIGNISDILEYARVAGASGSPAGLKLCFSLDKLATYLTTYKPMSSPLTTTTQLPTDAATSSNPSSSQPGPESSSPTAGELHPPDSQEISYLSSNPTTIATAIEHPQPSKAPGGRCYSRDELLHLKKSPLVAAPPGMPPRKEWFGYVALCTRGQCNAERLGSEFNEQAIKPKDHDGLTASRMRYLSHPTLSSEPLNSNVTM
jgi:hypothetical protein